MKRKFLSALIVMSGIFLTSCEYDNFEEPTSTLAGRVVFEGNAVGVRTNGPQLELWQDGYPVRSLIPVHIEHNGSFSANLFDGQYKLVRKGNSPWLPQQTDTLVINVKGNTTVDVPVIPYFTVSTQAPLVANSELTVNFTVNKHVASAELDAVRLYIGKSILVDHSRNEFSVSLNVSSLVLGTPATLKAQLPESLKNLPYVFVRVGVKAKSTGEYSYTQVQKIALK